jgi:hypothetical protein
MQSSARHIRTLSFDMTGLAPHYSTKPRHCAVPSTMSPRCLKSALRGRHIAPDAIDNANPVSNEQNQLQSKKQNEPRSSEQETRFVPAAAGTLDDPIVIRTPMYLMPSTSIAVGASLPLELRTSEISRSEKDQLPSIVVPNAPTKLVAHSRSRLFINPSEALGEAFRTGWRKLPDELRVMILEHNLVFNLPISHDLSSRSDHADSGLVVADWKGMLLAHLAMGPEISSLVKEVFYTNNTFLSSNRFLYRNLVLPNPSARQFIRHIHIIMDIEPRSLVRLANVANGTAGFSNLRSVDTTLNWAIDVPTLRDWLTVIEPIPFNCAATLSVPPLTNDMYRHIRTNRPFFDPWFVLDCLRVWMTATPSHPRRIYRNREPARRAVEGNALAILPVPQAVPGAVSSEAVSMAPADGSGPQTSGAVSEDNAGGDNAGGDHAGRDNAEC